MPVRGHFSISWEGGNHRLAPDVTYHPTLGQYLVVWEYEYDPDDHDVYRLGAETMHKIDGRLLMGIGPIKWEEVVRSRS